MHVRVWGFAGLFPKIALTIGVLTSSCGVRVRRFCGFVGGGLSHKVSLEVSCGVSTIIIQFNFF